MILRILRALPEKWLRASLIDLRWYYAQQCLYGVYPKGSFVRAQLDLLEAWTEFLFELCIALGSDIERKNTEANSQRSK
jgi:hypothetical protein